jgi:hypothetical protein
MLSGEICRDAQFISVGIHPMAVLATIISVIYVHNFCMNFSK